MIEFPKKQEILNRIEKLYAVLNTYDSDWDAIFLIDKINQYYFTGTMQEGVFTLKKDGSFAYFVRKSFDRAKMESPIENIYPMVSYKDVANTLGNDINKIYVETEIITYAAIERLKKYFKIDIILPVDKIIMKLRSVKSSYELAVMEESGRQHCHLLENIVPGLLKEGMNEAELTAELYASMVKLGYHGVSRFGMFQTEMVIGQLGFGENSLYPTSFDGPGGMKGMSPSVPIIGDRKRMLKKGDLVFIDVGYGVNGYHTDRTQVYMFGRHPPEDVISIHRQCIDVQSKIALQLKTGNIPGEIYNNIMDGLDDKFTENFMGFGNRKVKFLGHGVGLQIDEYPIITSGWNEPLVENMIISVEPKRGVAGIGMTGVEDTYIVTENGGRCITGGGKDIIIIA